jgi:hypothetical protein
MAKTARMSDQLRLETEQAALEEQAASLADKGRADAPAVQPHAAP